MTVAMHQVLIIEHEPLAEQVLDRLLEANGFRVVTCKAGRLARNDARLHRSDMVIVDLGLAPQEDLRAIRSIRSQSGVPIIVLSEHAQEPERIDALEAGADDYVSKPYSPRELIARVRAAVRRHVRGKLPMGVLQLGNVLIDLSRRSAQRSDGLEVRLTPMEHRILEALVRHADRIVSHSVLLREVWGPCQGDSQELRVYVRNLRRKLEEDPARPAYIVTEARIGYRLVLGCAAEAPAHQGRAGPAQQCPA